MKGKKTFENVEIEDISAEGKAVARVDNRVIFVEGAVPGDLADVQVIGKKKKFLIAKPTHFHRKSELRSDPKCDHFGVCGGCKWQNMKYEHQLLFKQKQVFETLKRIGKVEIQEELPIVGAEKTEYYRNKIEFSFSNKRWLTSEQIASEETFENNVLGFHVPKFFDKVVDIEKCHLQEDPSNDIRNFIREFALKHKISFYDIREH
ncbi:MAG: 23S rRNA (uracil-5-)-methyltransferase RumA, partial [Flavobacteriales bacterium]|nr:23S rRNA (uracil-5-)-methyltransferase RumA [Flavobacteriales bacterium]